MLRVACIDLERPVFFPLETRIRVSWKSLAIRCLSPASLAFGPLGLAVLGRMELPYPGEIIVDCREFFPRGDLLHCDPVDVLLFAVFYEVSFLSALETCSFREAFLSLWVGLLAVLTLLLRVVPLLLRAALPS